MNHEKEIIIQRILLVVLMKLETESTYHLNLKPRDFWQVASSKMVGWELWQNHGALQCLEIQSTSS